MYVDSAIQPEFLPCTNIFERYPSVNVRFPKNGSKFRTQIKLEQILGSRHLKVRNHYFHFFKKIDPLFLLLHSNGPTNTNYYSISCCHCQTSQHHQYHLTYSIDTHTAELRHTRQKKHGVSLKNDHVSKTSKFNSMYNGTGTEKWGGKVKDIFLTFVFFFHFA